MVFNPNFKAHLETRSTTVARAWEVNRSDGVRMGFTDHDQDLQFDGLTFSADAGLSARALAQSTGLSVDNAEALGALSDAGISETDIHAGRFDGAEVKAWLVNWSDTSERVLQFRGSIGEITKTGGEFRAELRGLTEALNLPKGRVYQAACSAVLGDKNCGFDLSTPGFAVETVVDDVIDAQQLNFAIMPAFAEGWFTRGRLTVLTGDAAGLSRVIKGDATGTSARIIELWETLTANIQSGDSVRLEAGCDKRVATCKAKFANFANFQGFPHVPGEDWLIAYPRTGERNDGGSLSV